MEPEKLEEDPAEVLSNLLQWACAPRGGNNFYARVLNGCGRLAAPGLGTCGVTIDREGRYLLLWDPEWLVQQAEPFRVLVIVHEAAHLILRHIERGLIIRRQLMDDTKANKLHEVLNIAMDMAVNDISVRPLLEDSSMRFKEFGADLVWPEDRKYPRGLTAEDYLTLLLKDLKDHGWDIDDKGSEVPSQGGQGQGEGSGGEGSGGEGSGGEGSEGEGSEGEGAGGEGEGKLPGWFKRLLEKKHASVDWAKEFENMTDGEIQRALDRAKREARKIAHQAAKQTKQSRGVIPLSIQSVIEELLEDPVIPWQEVLRRQLRSAISQKLDESTAYPSVALLNNDSYEPYPGFQNNFTFNILAAFDTSGSMSSDDFKDCCIELRGLLEKEDGVTVRLLHFDYGIQYEAELTTEDAVDLRRSSSRYGGGGTSFEEPLRYAINVDTDSDWVTDAESDSLRRNPFDLMLLFTDGYAPIPLPQLDPKIPLFWVLTEDGQSDDRMKLILRMGD